MQIIRFLWANRHINHDALELIDTPDGALILLRDKEIDRMEIDFKNEAGNTIGTIGLDVWSRPYP